MLDQAQVAADVPLPGDAGVFQVVFAQVVNDRPVRFLQFSDDDLIGDAQCELPIPDIRVNHEPVTIEPVGYVSSRFHDLRSFSSPARGPQARCICNCRNRFCFGYAVARTVPAEHRML